MCALYDSGMSCVCAYIVCNAMFVMQVCYVPYDAATVCSVFAGSFMMHMMCGLEMEMQVFVCM